MKAGKIVMRIAVVIVVLVVVIALAAYFFGESALRSGVESAATKTLQVPVTLERVNLSLFRGKVEIGNLAIANPPDYQNPTLMRLGNGNVQVRLGSLLTDTVNIEHVQLDGLELTIEQRGLTNNLQQVLENIRKSMPAEEPEDVEGKQLRIDKLELTNIAVSVKLLPLPGRADTITLKLDPIIMENIGTDEPVDTAVLTAKILAAIAAGVARQGSGILPEGMIGNLADGLQELGGGIVGESLDILRGAGGGIIDSSRDAGETLRDIFRRRGNE